MSSRLLVVSWSQRSGWSDWRASLEDLIRLWPLVFLFASRNIKLKYKQAVLGIAWAVVQPLALTVVFSLFTHRLGEPLRGQVPYKAFTMSTLIGWTFFQTVVSLGAQGPLSDGGLMQRIYYPREFSVLGWCFASVLDLAIVVFLFLVMMPFFGISLSWTVVFVIPLALILLIMGTGIGFLIGAVMVYYRDVRYALPLVMQLWLFASPVAYPLASVPEEWRFLYIVVNPVAGVLENFYRSLAAGVVPDPVLLAISCAEAAILLVLGYIVFKMLERNFADVV